MLRRRVKHKFERAVSLIKRAAYYLTGGSWKRTLFGVAVLGSVFAAGGFLYAWLGLVPIAASEGHWRITEKFLRFTMSNSVELRSMNIEPPPLDDPALALKAAGHYATGCAPCHGAPGEPRSPIVKQMTPQPPPLPSRVLERRPEQLFWIVKHGIKYTAMPGWVALERDDEVWSMVAFLLQLPKLGPERYRQLAYGERIADLAGDEEGGDAVSYFFRPLTEPVQLIVADCARCHGADGNGRGLDAFPKLAGQNEDYLLASLRAFSRGERLSGIMQPVAAGLSEETLRTLARYYARMAPSLSGNERQAVEGDAEHGRRIAEQGIPAQGVPSCVDCHGPGYEPRNPLYPELAGQYAGYLALQLELFRAGRRGGTPYAHVMNQAAGRLTRAQIHDLAAYYASVD